jgi:hypothetical protein
MREKFEQMMELYADIKSEVRKRDKHLYERWKAGGFIVDDDILSMYPDLGKVVDQLSDDEKCRYCDGNCPNEPEDSVNLCDGFAGDIDGLYSG